MTNKIRRTIFNTSIDNLSCAADLSNEDHLTASFLHYLTLPKNPKKRLHLLSKKEQKSLWEYTEEIITIKATQYPKHPFAILLNDGDIAGQTVGHVHIHIVGFKENKIFNLEEKLNTLLKEVDKAPLTYIDRIEIKCLISELGNNIPATIEKYLNEDYGFSFLSKNTFLDPKKEQTFTFQIFEKDKPRSYGLTNLTRVMNGLRKKPTTWPPENKNAIFDLIST